MKAQRLQFASPAFILSIDVLEANEVSLGNGRAQKREHAESRPTSLQIHGQAWHPIFRFNGLQTLDGSLRAFVFKYGGETVQHGNEGGHIIGTEQAFVHLITVHHAVSAFSSLVRNNREACRAEHIDIPIDRSLGNLKLFGQQGCRQNVVI
ncbi:hypothetical protein D3C81_1524290 [compost metagenome]